MITGWKEVTTSGIIPPGVRICLDNSFGRKLVPMPKIGDWGRWFTEEQECPECYFTTHINDQMGLHVCPELKDCNHDKMTTGDFVYAYFNEMLRRCRLIKFKKETGRYTVEDIATSKRAAINKNFKILKAGEHEQAAFDQRIN